LPAAGLNRPFPKAHIVTLQPVEIMKLKFPCLPLSLSVAFALAGNPPALSAAPAADFTLPAADGGKPFVLAEHRGHYVALHFLLKTECPFCLGLVQEYGRKSALLPEVVQVFIKPDDEAALKDWVAKLPPNLMGKFALHRDPDAALARELGVPEGYLFHGESVHYPALVLVGPDGSEVFRHVGKNNTDRFKFDQLAAKLDELSPNPSLDQYNLPKERLAIGGYDPVAYFTDGQTRQGEPALRARYRGVTYQFASQKSLDQFLAGPAKFVPTYGGWCATAMANGEKVEIDPTNFKVNNGRLFLFYKGLWGNARKDWDQDEPAQIKKADAAWKKFANE
jgi:peroxiredoxin Q/BCP